MKARHGLTLLLLLCLTALCGAAAETSGDFSYTVDEDGCAVITAYGGDAARVKIPAELDGHPVVAIGDAAFRGCARLERVTLPEGLLRIGDEAFAGCEALLDIAPPDTDDMYLVQGAIEIPIRAVLPDGLVSVGGRAFYGCCGLHTVLVPASVTEIGVEAFRVTGDGMRITRQNGKPGFVHYDADLVAEAGSYAEQYAKANRMNVYHPEDIAW